MRVSTALLLAFPIVLYADTRTVTKMTFGGHVTVTTEYVQGDKRRMEFSGVGRPGISIGGEKRARYQLDVLTHTYVEYPYAPPGARIVSTHESGKTIDVYFETVDTGERREFFGKTARHLILRQRTVAEPGACGQSQVFEKDGWYLPQDDPNSRRGYFAFLSGGIVGSPICRDKYVSHGSLPAGLAVLETSRGMTREVLEFSEAPLDPGLFDVPSGYRKVQSLPSPQMTWSERLLWEWEKFLSWFSLGV
jgi:hypothetical protein